MKIYIRTLKIIYFTTLFGPVMLVLIANYRMVKGNPVSHDNLEMALSYVNLVLGAIAISAGYVIYKRQIAAVIKLKSPRDRLAAYQSALILRIAFIEGVAMLSAIGYMVTSDKIFILYMVVFLVFYLPVYPVADRICRILEIDPENLSGDKVNQ